MSLDPKKQQAIHERALADLGGALTALLVHMGDKLGLYKAMSGVGFLSSADLAGRTGTRERYVREWLNNQAAAGYVEYDAALRKYRLSDEAAQVLAREDSPSMLAGAFEAVAGLAVDEPKLTAAFRSGAGVPWGDHDPRLFSGLERFLRPEYAANLMSSWLPALPGVVDKLQRGGQVADVGCGRGSATLMMAKAFPRSAFSGFDPHRPSIDHARAAAAEAHLQDRVQFELSTAKEYKGVGYDLVTILDCLHDMGDPAAALKHVRASLAKDGAVLVVEPKSDDHLEKNLTPLGRFYFGFSTLVCTPSSLAQEVALGLGAQTGEWRIRVLAHEAGLDHVRIAARTALHTVFEVKP